MIEFFTVLVLTYYVQEERWNIKVIYDTEDRCQEAMDRGVMMPLYNQLMDLYGNNMMMRCETTDIVSTFIKPQIRPNK